MLASLTKGGGLFIGPFYLPLWYDRIRYKLRTKFKGDPKFMKRFSILLLSAVALAFCLCPSPAMAQQAPAAQSAQHKTPMLSDGHVDLTGIWLNAAPRGAGAGFGRQYPD